MPEGDSIYQLSRRLQFMVGRTVLAADVRVPRHPNISGKHRPTHHELEPAG